MERMCCDLPDEVLEEIFSWLPPECLIQFKCVGPLWYGRINSLIKNEAFVNRHLHNIENRMSSSSTSLVFCCISFSLARFRRQRLIRGLEVEPHRQKLYKSITVFCNANESDHLSYGDEVLDLPTFTSGVVNVADELRSHCNGIICFAHQSSSIVSFCNPAIKEWRTLPEPCLAHGGFTMLGMGFGYDSRANDYKVVRFGHETFLRDGIGYFKIRAEVYSMRSDSWREIGNCLEFDCRPIVGKEVFCKGVFYWFVLTHNIIVSFNMFDEVFHRIQLSNDLLVSRENHSIKLAVWNETVALFIYQQQIAVTNSIDVWVMDESTGGVEDCSSWTKKLIIGPLVDIGVPLIFLKNDELLMQTNAGELILYNVRSQILRKHTRKHTIFQANTISSFDFSYVRSLVSVQGGSQFRSQRDIGTGSL